MSDKVDTSRERLEKLRDMGVVDYIHMALLEEREALEKEVLPWRYLRDAVAEIEGHGPDWPTHGNVPLAIAAGYSLWRSKAFQDQEKARANKDPVGPTEDR